MASTTRSAAVVGSAAGGLIVALSGARRALGADAATFAASALIIRLGDDAVAVGLLIAASTAFGLAGTAAEVIPPATVVALRGAVGAVIACRLAFRGRKCYPSLGRHTARHHGREASLAS
jgi:hypothetical protein